MRFNVLIVSDAQLDQEASERALIAWYDRDGTHDGASKWDYLDFVESRPAADWVPDDEDVVALVRGDVWLKPERTKPHVMADGIRDALAYQPPVSWLTKVECHG